MKWEQRPDEETKSDPFVATIKSGRGPSVSIQDQTLVSRVRTFGFPMITFPDMFAFFALVARDATGSSSATSESESVLCLLLRVAPAVDAKEATLL